MTGFGATSIDKIGKVQLSDEIGKGGLKFTIRYEIPTFSSVGHFLKRGEGIQKNFDKKLKF